MKKLAVAHVWSRTKAQRQLSHYGLWILIMVVKMGIDIRRWSIMIFIWPLLKRLGWELRCIRIGYFWQLVWSLSQVAWYVAVKIGTNTIIEKKMEKNTLKSQKILKRTQQNHKTTKKSPLTKRINSIFWRLKIVKKIKLFLFKKMNSWICPNCLHKINEWIL